MTPPVTMRVTTRLLLDLIRCMDDDERQELSDLLGELPIPSAARLQARVVYPPPSDVSVISTAEDCGPSHGCTTDDAGHRD